ncbi:hypothetical protein VAPA_1c31970 [Variovorax paradoxus B4]|uniref:Uncharacterized protein n=1 Tax=Variovorax paradoxus B4 TaxID=1246301 RepID=T1XD86_VARPD|nr:hypothetical protein VAPA_1c31970 [Variovorax paradoxus B4]
MTRCEPRADCTKGACWSALFEALLFRARSRRRDRYADLFLIGQYHSRASRAQGIGCSPQRNKGGAEGGGHSRRGAPDALCTHPEQDTSSCPAPGPM